MKITLQSTDMIVQVYPDGHLTPGKPPVPARIWEGHTESGVPVVCLVTRIMIPEKEVTPERERQFAAELKECKPPDLMPRSYDMRFFLD